MGNGSNSGGQVVVQAYRIGGEVFVGIGKSAQTAQNNAARHASAADYSGPAEPLGSPSHRSFDDIG